MGFLYVNVVSSRKINKVMSKFRFIPWGLEIVATRISKLICVKSTFNSFYITLVE